MYCESHSNQRKLKMKLQQLKVRKVMTTKERVARKERKRICKIEGLILSQSSIIKFHELYEIVGDKDAIKTKEINAANEKIAELQKQLSQE